MTVVPQCRDHPEIARQDWSFGLRHRDTTVMSRAGTTAPVAKLPDMSATVETNGRTDDLVHLDQAAAALGVSRRTIERLIADEKLERAPGPDGRTYVTKSSLVAEKDGRENGTAGGPQSSEARRGATELRATVGQLT